MFSFSLFFTITFFCIRRYFHRISQEISPRKTRITSYIYFISARGTDIRKRN